MANMSYCRFTNTVADLRDCYDNMEDPDGLSKPEAEARRRLIKLAKRIADDYGDEDADAHIRTAKNLRAVVDAAKRREGGR